jgi:hypothetical protein
MTRFLCTEKADKKFCKTRGEEQSKEVDSRQQQPAVSRLKHKEGRTLQADPRFQAVSRLSRPDKEENPRWNSSCTATSPEGQTKTSGSQQPGRRRWPNTTNHFILFYCFYCLNFIYLFNLLFLFYLFNIQFSDHSTCNSQQEDEIWTQGGIQRLVD